jgi:hypothetical protein
VVGIDSAASIAADTPVILNLIQDLGRRGVWRNPATNNHNFITRKPVKPALYWHV